MMTKLEDLKHLAFSPLQMNVLRKAEKDGLNLEWLANTNLDYLQMEEIYLCLKYDVDPSSISDPDIPAESMRSLREHLFEMQGVSEETAREAMRLASHKLPVKCKFIKREDA